MNISEFTQLLKDITVDSKDDGKQFTVFDRIHVIRKLLTKSSYQLLYEGKLSLVYGRKPVGDKEVLLISSHIDCVYGSCFCKENEDYYKGTFDNSLTNTAVLYNMLNNRFADDVVIAFTGDEEKDSAGCWETLRLFKNKGWQIRRAVVTDVTAEAWNLQCAFTIENDLGIDMLTAHRLVEELKPYEDEYVLVHNAEPDESWDLNVADVPCFTLCIPTLGEMHGDEGILARKKSIPVYCEVLALMANCPE